MYVFQEFEKEQSLATVAVSVAFFSFLMGPIIGGLVVLLFLAIARDPAKSTVFFVFGSAWVALTVCAIRYAVWTVRRWAHPRPATTPFLIFQLTAGSVLLLIAFTSDGGNAGKTVTDAVKWIFAAMLFVANTTFLILARTVRVKPSAMTWIGALYDLATIVLPFLV
jgi:hypothetical protein